MSGKEAQLTQLLRPTVESMGYSLWGIELISPGKRPTVRLTLRQKPASRSMTAHR